MLDASAADTSERAHRAVKDLGMRGICLFPAMHHVRMDDERVIGIAEIAAAHPGTAVFVHCGMLSIGVRRKLGLSSRFDVRLGDPLALCTLALAYPTVPFIVPHFGSGLLREALMISIRVRTFTSTRRAQTAGYVTHQADAGGGLAHSGALRRCVLACCSVPIPRTFPAAGNARSCEENTHADRQQHRGQRG